MHDEILKADEIFLQDIVCDKVIEDLKAEDFKIYNKVVEVFEVSNFDTTLRILHLIKLTKQALAGIDELQA